MSSNSFNLVTWFRDSSPYINQHRHTTAVIAISSEALSHANRRNFLHDIATLRNLGMKIVIVFGTRTYIDQELIVTQPDPLYHNGRRVTDKNALKTALKVSGYLQFDIESQLSMGLANSPMHRADINVVSGNFIVAKPLGIIDGIDHQHTGEVRRVNAEAIRDQLDRDNIVLIAPIGHSPSGESFNLESESLAGIVAQSIGAQKLIIAVKNRPSSLPQQIICADVERVCQQYQVEGDLLRSLRSSAHCVSAGVERAHLIDISVDGSLLTEMYTRDGIGTMVIEKSYMTTRAACIDDLTSIISLIRPLEQQGLLVKRSRKQLETELKYFSVIEKDGLIISCCALYPFSESTMAEVACVATHADYQGVGAARELLTYVEALARQQKKTQVFLLTTGSAHWFVEQGFVQSSVADLPTQKQSMYNYQRNSKVMIKAL